MKVMTLLLLLLYSGKNVSAYPSHEAQQSKGVANLVSRTSDMSSPFVAAI
jgi:hypothetical protein